jgi:hypothetical protein
VNSSTDETMPARMHLFAAGLAYIFAGIWAVP